MRTARVVAGGVGLVLALDALALVRGVDAPLGGVLAAAAVALNLAVATAVLAAVAAREPGQHERGGGMRGTALAALVLMAAGLGVTAYGTRLFWGVARYGTLPVVQAMLGALGRQVAVEPGSALIRCDGFAVRIEAPCSGLEGVALLWCFLGVHLLASRRRLDARRAALVVAPIATAVMWIANAARIAGLMLLGAAGHRELALGGFHSHAGWLLFDAVALGALVAVEVWFARPVADAGPHAAADAPDSGAPIEAWVLPQLTCLALGLLAEAADPRPAGWYPLKVLATAGVLVLVWRSWRPAWRAPDAAAAVWGLVAFAVWMALEPAGPPAATPASDGWIALRVLGSVLVVPLAEELAFRGFLMRRLAAAEFARTPYAACGPAAILLSSLAFGALHSRFLAGTLAGLAYALAARRRGELADAVAAHAVTNLALAATVLATGRTSLW